jgi:RNA polymerase sigma-70 factor (ECF subfamily)
MVTSNSVSIQSKESSNFHSIGAKNKGNLNSKDKIIALQTPLIEACKRNDAEAQKKLYDSHVRAMFGTCLRMTGQREDAQDVLQESFIAAFKGIQNFNGQSTFGAWLKRIVINKCINHLNKKRILVFENVPETVEGELIEEDDEIVLTTQRIQQAIMELPVGCRTVFVMKVLEGFDHKEIAEVTGISVGTSKSQFNRARQLLQIALKDLRK